MKRSAACLLAVLVILVACEDEGEKNEARTLDQMGIEQALLEEDDLPTSESLNQRPDEPVTELRRCFELAHIPASAGVRGLTESAQNGAGYSQLLLSYTQGDAAEAFGELVRSYSDCDELPQVVSEPIGDDSAQFHVDSYFQAYLVVWRREDVISIVSAVERPLSDALLMSRVADGKLAGVLDELGEPSDEPAPEPTAEPFEFENFSDFDGHQLLWLGDQFEGWRSQGFQGPKTP